MKKLMKISARPKLNEPNMVAAWPGIGGVATIVAAYLKKKLNFKDLGELDAPYFFEPVGVLVRDNVVEEPQFPQTKFHYFKNKEGANDVILVMGDDQPQSKSYELANCIVDLALRFHVKRIYTCAAALTRIHHTEQPKVWGVATSPDITPDLAQHDLIKNGNLHISGMNGLILGVAKERGVDAVCLLGEVPLYATKIQNPMAALAILDVLAKILAVDVDMTELAQIASETKERMKQVAAEAMGEYIDYFTAPIWEQGEEEEDEDEEE